MKPRILIVDDDIASRIILRARLESAGYEVAEAGNGEEGLAAVKARLPDMLFLDVMMPKVDGWKVCKALKKNPATRDIPIVMLTALGREIEELRGWESGADDYIVKPFEPQNVFGIIEKLLKTGREEGHGSQGQKAERA